MEDERMPVKGFADPKGNQFGLRAMFDSCSNPPDLSQAQEALDQMKNQIQTAIELRDRATQVALNFVGHHISSSDGSYSLLIDCIHDALNQTFVDGASSVAPKDLTDTQLAHACQCNECDPHP